MKASPRGLDPDQVRRLEAGEHEGVAAELAAAGRHAAAGEVLEQIWAFAAAAEAYLRADAPVDALRAALEARDPGVEDRVLHVIEAHGDPQTVRAAVALLQKRGRHAAAARLLERDEDSVDARVRALVRAGDVVAAAQALADHGRSHDALELLGPVEERPGQARALALAAKLRWELGDAEGTARTAQAGLRAGSDDDELPALLARALGTLGHDLAAQVALQGRADHVDIAPVRGRYHVTGTLPATIAGAAYVGLDRVTLQEVEIHLLLADYAEGDRPDPGVRAAIAEFARTATAAQALAHPAIRPIVRVEEDAGLLVLPRAEGPGLRSLIREPGMVEALPRARAMAAFLLEGLVAAHARGLVHGSIMPSQIVCDTAGRPRLGPFGVHHLAGLIATRTGGLEEVLSMTAPELRAGQAPTTASDVFSVGAIYLALLLGEVGGDASPLPAAERELVGQMLAAIPEQRPSAAEAFAQLRVPVADVSRVAGWQAVDPGESQRGRTMSEPGLGKSVVVTADPSWSDALLERLGASTDPWLQTILDRDGRTWWLAPWPDGCRALPDSQDWEPLVGEQALASLDPELAAAIIQRMGPDAIVATPAGEWMIALDRLLARAG